MPRTGVIYSPPAGTKGAPRTTIQSSKYNALVDDLTLDANAARPLTAGGTGATNASQARKNLGSEIGVDVQAFDALLQSIASLTTSANQIIVATGVDAVTTKPVTAYGLSLLNTANSEGLRTELGFGTIAMLSSINDTNWSGADLSIANGGTGASTAAAARTNLDVPSNSGLTAGLAGKVDVTNPQMTGNPVITNTRPTVLFNTSPVSQSWLLDALSNDSSFRLVDSTAVAEIVKFFTTGAVWTKQLGDLKTYIDTKAPLASPVFSGNPTAPNQLASDSSTRIANTATVDAKISANSPMPFTQEFTSGLPYNAATQNSTGKPIFVSITGAARSGTGTGAAGVVTAIQIGPSAGSLVERTNTRGISTADNQSFSSSANWIIPPGYFYNLVITYTGTSSNRTMAQAYQS